MSKRILLVCLIPVLSTIQLKCASEQGCCIISPPPIQVTGEQTTIERQISGDYEELEKDAWAISSVKSSVQRSRSRGSLMTTDAELNRALKLREYHETKIRLYKDHSAIGERNDGLLQYMPVHRYEQDKEERAELLRIMEQENKARKIIFSRVLLLRLKKEPSEQEKTRFASLFADEQRATARKNDWIQNPSGRWEKK